MAEVKALVENYISKAGKEKTCATVSLVRNRSVVMVVDPNEDIYADDPNKLKESKEKILKLADYIIPGHVGMYKVKK